MTTEGVIILIWSATLLLALGITIVAVSMIVRIVLAAREVDRLLKETLPAAGGIAANTAAIMELEAVVAAAGPLLEGTAAIGRAAAGIHEKVGRVGRLLAGEARP
ncbi:MAG: hypothetical protein H0V51_16530 [Chloroflexi bacterium]|nr:hypothetical protein [Chloroflexota bacterium]